MERLMDIGEINKIVNPRNVHLTRASFFNNGAKTPRLGNGGVEVALGIGGRHFPDIAVTVQPLAEDVAFDKRWTVHAFDKREIPELGLQGTELPIAHGIAEQRVPKEEYDGFRQWSIAMWWIHHSMEKNFLTDAKQAGLDKNFLSSHTAHRRINAEAARLITQLPSPSDAIMIQDPYYYPWVARSLKNQHRHKSRIVGVNHIPFPEPENFAMLRHISPDHWEKLARSYMDGWMSFDALSFHTPENVDSFRQSAARFWPDRKLPELIVNPLGVETERIEKIATSVTETDEKRLLGLVVEHAPYLTDSIDLQGKDIGIGVGYRSDPIKQIPVVFEAMYELLEKRPDLRGQITYVQQLRPHRIEDFESYRQEYEKINFLAQMINEKYAHIGWQPIILIPQGLNHEDVIRMQSVLAKRARKSFTALASVEGMNLAAQETVFASQRDEFGLIATRGSGLGITLADNGASELVVPEKKPDAAMLASYVEKFLDLPEEETIRINNDVKKVLNLLHPQGWMDKLAKVA